MYSGEEVYFERRQNLIIIVVLYILRQRRNRQNADDIGFGLYFVSALVRAMAII